LVADRTDGAIERLAEGIFHAILRCRKGRPQLFRRSDTAFMNDSILQQQLQIAQFGAHVTAAQLHVLVQRFWMDELEKPRNADPKRLLRYGFKVYSQNDEDGIIQEIFRRIGMQHRTFIEFGVQTGSECNTAKLLLEGWRGLWIEADSMQVRNMRQSLGMLIGNKSLTLTEALVTAENVNGLFCRPASRTKSIF
jgi:hypothetical protein